MMTSDEWGAQEGAVPNTPLLDFPTSLGKKKLGQHVTSRESSKSCFGFYVNHSPMSVPPNWIDLSRSDCESSNRWTRVDMRIRFDRWAIAFRFPPITHDADQSKVQA